MKILGGTIMTNFEELKRILFIAFLCYLALC